MKRNIIQIDEEKCNGCGLCATACHEGAIEIVDGKARLISDKYCDGLGDCLPTCPTDAIKMIEREADAYDDDAVQALKKEKEDKSTSEEPKLPCGCPGTMAKMIKRDKTTEVTQKEAAPDTSDSRPSELAQWPVQLKLINSKADYLHGANLLVAADCTAFSYGDFHRNFIKDHTVVIGCPKLDDNQYYTDKLSEILAGNDIKSITAVKMEVPCCNGIVQAVKQAMLNTQKIVPYREVTIGLDGSIR
ncbi:4Fe-4S dicluster domain-containing protein [Dehalobacterium formicoaceticum]|uniref:4Fe-4S dicluster domain-containing protein n=1 Tax=Dehalobacterium formicoaceticum TaxID=51515 RepID=A0ABT1XZH1_9FIRM|nr:4Fe-4S dicluster domain-containing protein [Dehalobacterium formicoaceticum]MCR6544022.1 4Fe-4S dicluster domain-containing protein [Dehalobacterium formicoaceticum]